MKSFTDLEQSKKLAEILPIESADMEYIFLKEDNTAIGNVPFVKDDSEVENSGFNYVYNRTPCWSLAALLDILPDDCGIDKEDGKYVASYIISDECGAYTKDNSVDACYEMILKLHELKML